jgi:transcriptional regulator with XRE-family HTH domain
MSDAASGFSQDSLIDGERVVALLWRNRLSQRKLAQRLGMDAAGLGRKLRGLRPWYLHEAKALAGELGVSLSYLMGETDDQHVVVGGQQKAPVSGETGASVAGAGFEPTTSGL